MTNPDIIQPADIKAAAAKIDEAYWLYQAHGLSLAEVDPGTALVGGNGKTGAYCAGLKTFSQAFTDVLGEFLADEAKFVAFLAGFRDRINQAAGMYEANELRGAERFTSISKTLDEGGA